MADVLYIATERSRAAVVRFCAAVDHLKLFKIAETLLVSLERQLEVMAKSSSFAGKEDIVRCSKVALILAAKIRTELQDHAGGNPASRGPNDWHRDGKCAPT